METVIRIVILYTVIITGLRILGKREFGQLSPAELVTLLIIPEIVSPALVREDPSLTNAIVGTTTLFSLVFVVSLLMHHVRPLEKVVSSSPTLLVSDGRFLAENMNKERVSPEEIYTEIRKVGLHELAQVRWVVLESDGTMSVIPKPGVDRHMHAESSSSVGGG
ncbi:Protein of unknown function [Nannocystis exedens]|uniref:YetF C-terminal domain-containing protein n=1 Tax=Nannocystis exedens TaxID=54 RepID=A0A1I2HPX6_9BACT|nr:YetF domain-containing protein [Nannocystis exedens]PCC71990.1 hypothetical protein NAEX_05069 [Nannocystis exedens]SFF30421.1 Protein of unknown function [Nannocystis exedens]